MLAFLAEISAADFETWHAYAELEPDEQERADLRAALLASAVANQDNAGEAVTLQDAMLVLQGCWRDVREEREVTKQRKKIARAKRLKKSISMIGQYAGAVIQAKDGEHNGRCEQHRKMVGPGNA